MKINMKIATTIISVTVSDDESLFDAFLSKVQMKYVNKLYRFIYNSDNVIVNIANLIFLIKQTDSVEDIKNNEFTVINSTNIESANTEEYRQYTLLDFDTFFPIDI